jgi:hypothetical protein
VHIGKTDDAITLHCMEQRSFWIFSVVLNLHFNCIGLLVIGDTTALMNFNSAGVAFLCRQIL